MFKPVATYSIVARDRETGQLGVAVQSHYMAVGSIVTWAHAGVGAIATQSFVDVSYGPLGLTLLQAGKTPEQALNGLLAADARPEVRQVAMVDAEGNVAVHTGEKSVRGAGHHKGDGYSAQANLMLNDTIWDAMASAYESAQGDLAERLVVALEAAEKAGGDIRGKQSAALLVVQGERTLYPWQGRIFDIRVDDHPEPLPELRRLLSLARAYRHEDAAESLFVDTSLGDERIGRAVEEFSKALSLMPPSQNPEIAYWGAVGLASGGRLDEALPLFAQVFAINNNWRELTPRLVDAGLLPDNPEVLRRILAV